MFKMNANCYAYSIFKLIIKVRASFALLSSSLWRKLVIYLHIHSFSQVKSCNKPLVCSDFHILLVLLVVLCYYYAIGNKHAQKLRNAGGF